MKVMKLTTLLFAIATIMGCVEANGGVTPEVERPEWEATTVKCYDYAPTVVPSIFYSVKVNGQSAMTLPTTEAHVCLFSCDGLVEVEIDNLRTAVESVVVRPISKNYTYSHDGSSVKLYLRPYDQVVVEINGDETNPLFVFVNPLEDGGRPQEDDPNVKVFKAGGVYGLNQTQLIRSGQTIYIEGGAILTGGIISEGIENVKIAGCGIIDGRETSTQAIKIGKAKGVTIENVTVLNRDKWTTYLWECEDILVDNYKVVAVATTHHQYGAENDGCDLLGCKNAVVKRSFSYCHDDAFCIKAQKWLVGAEVDNVEFNECIAWNVGGGNSFEIGYELNQNVNNVRYRNVYAVRTAGRSPSLRRGAIGLQNGAGGKVTNISYDGVWVEEPREYGIYMGILKSSYDIGNGVTWTPGEIDGVSLKNIHFLVKPPMGFHFEGYDVDVHRIKNVTLENVTIEGERVTAENAKAMGFVINKADVEIK